MINDRDLGSSGPDYGIPPSGYRLPAAAHPGAIRLQVTDLERSLEYYRSVISLRPLEVGAGSAILAAQGEDRPLIHLEENPNASPVPPHGRLGLYHFAILLPTRADLGRFIRHLASLGVRAGASDHLVSEALYLHDPDGLGIEVYADRPRSEWEHAGRELRMSTIPLNVPEVVAASGDTLWDGLPAGTVMGHLHLHVGDLEEAASFYHEALGLDKVVWSYPGALFLSAGGYHHHLGLNTWAASSPSAGGDDAKLLEWSLVLPDTESVSGAARSLEEAGYPVDRVSEGEFVTRDPWGTRLRLVA